MRIYRDLVFDKGWILSLCQFSFSLMFWALIAQITHTHRCVFHAPEPCGQGSTKPSLICTSVQLVGTENEIKELSFPFK